MPVAGTNNISFEKGTTHAFQVTINENGSAKNLTGYNARLIARTDAKGGATLLTLSSEGAGPQIAITAASGLLMITFKPTDTSSVAWATAFYELQIYTASDAVVTPILKGSLTLV